MRPSTRGKGFGYWSATALSALLLAACAEPGDPADTVDSDTPSASSSETADTQETDTESATSPVVNPGCDAEPAFFDQELTLEVEVDLTHFGEDYYLVRERLTVVPSSSGAALSLFGEGVEILAASAGWAHDGHVATFCVPAYEAGDSVEIEATIKVLASEQVDYGVIRFGMQQWRGNGGLVIGPFNEPYFAPHWLLVPQAPGPVSPEHDGSPAVISTQLAVIVPDDSWVVLGPSGLGIKDGNRHVFELDSPLPLYALSFAASPDYEVIEVGQSEAGVEVLAAVFQGSQASALGALSPVPAALDFMAQRIGPYAFGETLAFVEIPGYGGGMEHVGAVWIGTEVLTPDFTGQFVAVHEALHMYWGNAVRFADWPHFWLAEGFDEWSTNYGALEVVLNDEEMKAHRLEYRQQAAVLTQPLMGGMPQPGPLRFGDDDDMLMHFFTDLQLYYIYGAAFLEMVNQRLVRHYDTDLETLLSDWYAEKLYSAATTEEFLAFLQEQTDDTPSWQALFDDWVYQTPCPSLRAEGYSWDGETVRFVLRRGSEGGAQDLSQLEVAFDLGGQEQRGTFALSSVDDQVEVEMALDVEPSGIAVDPDQLYILELTLASSWAGPPIGFDGSR